MNNWKMVLGAVLGCLFLVGVMVWGLSKMGGEQSGLDVSVDKLVDGAGWVNETCLTSEPSPPTSEQAPGGSSSDERGCYKVTVVEFSDLQCSACRQGEQVAKKLRQMDGVRFVFRYFPLLTIHKSAWKAARVTETAKKMDKGWEMLELLFKKQEDWVEGNDFDEKAMRYVKELELNEGEFKVIYDSGDIDGQIVKDSVLAKELNLGGTPTFFVEGKPVATNFVLTRVEEILNNR